MSKFRINLTLLEKRRFWKAGLSLRQMDNYSMQQILDAIKANSEREKQIRKQFFGHGSYELEKDLVGLIGAESAQELFRKDKINLEVGVGTAMEKIVKWQNSMFPRGTQTMLDAIQRSVDPFKKFYDRRDILSNFKPINEQMARLVNDANTVNRIADSTAISRLLSPLDTKLSRSLVQQDIFKKLDIVSLVRTLSETASSFETHTASVSASLIATSSFTKLAEYHLGGFNWDRIGKRVNLSDSLMRSTQSSFINASAGYSDFLRSINEKPNWLYQVPGIVKASAEDFYVASRILKIVSAGESESEADGSEKQIHAENHDIISKYLSLIHLDLPDVWSGALQAMTSNNPDKIRHMITSLRELYTHVLHLLAPDEAVKMWSNNSDYYHNGKPTRRARFLYLCRNLSGSNTQLAKLLKLEIDATLAMIELFQGGTHTITPPFSPVELNFIKIKADTTLRTFLLLEFEINRLH